MQIKAKIEIKDRNNSFAVTSQEHHTILEAFAEIVNVAERQKQSMENQNHRRKLNARHTRYHITS